ncbi:unnamed protein product [Didymodactylos carnosus]|uniref:Uncharacterized protein n=1 Tax=Didymodactylos carnosus TaxID=1234261 RepID=A0A8S2SSM3_9BILA|nr:unnamed protein product [Didymodactylos carnosus]
MIIRCFEYMENMKMIIKDEEIVHGKIERLLKGLETAFQYQYDISDLVAILMKVDLLADSINKHPSFTSNFLSKSPPDSIHAVQQLKEMLTFRPYMQRSAANEIWDYSAYRERGLFEMIGCPTCSKIMNKSFLSTTKLPEVAIAFGGGDGPEQFLTKTSDNRPIEATALCTYIIRNMGTALDIETLSEATYDEEEVLVLPFSAFKVKSLI